MLVNAGFGGNWSYSYSLVNIVFVDTVGRKLIFTLIGDFCAYPDRVSIWKGFNMSCSSSALNIIIKLDHTLRLESFDINLKIIWSVSHTDVGLSIRHPPWHHPVVIKVLYWGHDINERNLRNHSWRRWSSKADSRDKIIHFLALVKPVAVKEVRGELNFTVLYVPLWDSSESIQSMLVFSITHRPFGWPWVKELSVDIIRQLVVRVRLL